MGTVTSTLGRLDSIWPPSLSKIDRDPVTRHLWAVLRTTASATEVNFYRSTNGGGTWSGVVSVTGLTGLSEVGPLLVDSLGYIHYCFRTNVSNQDRVYYQRISIASLTASTAWLLAAADNGGTAGAVYSGMDLMVTLFGSNFVKTNAVIAVGTVSGSQVGVTLLGIAGTTGGNMTPNNAIIAGRRQWLATATTGRSTPALDIEHGTNPKSASPPNLWLAWGRTRLSMVKLAWNGSGWTGPTAEQVIIPSKAGWDYTVARYTGNEFVMAIPDAGSTVRIIERNKANTSHVVRNTPVHPQSSIRSFGINYSSGTRNLRVYAVGTSNGLLYFVDYERSSGTWNSWTQVSGDILTTNTLSGSTHGPDGFTIRRGTYLDTKHELIEAEAGVPIALTSYHQTLSFAPTASWDSSGDEGGVIPGSAAAVADPLILDWIFSDQDDTDTQTAWALQRQIGAGTLNYYRASDQTWQTTEQKNGSLGSPQAATIVTLAASWGLDADANHTYKVKVWDTADLASSYSVGAVVTPSAKVNPVITAPTEAQVLTGSTLTVTWTAASQTAWRVRVLQGGAAIHDTKFKTGAQLEYPLPIALQDGQAYVIELTTKNSEGLSSTAQTKNITVDFVEPPTPQLTVTPVPGEGLIRVQMAALAPVGAQPAVSGVDLYRRVVRYPNLLPAATANFETGVSAWTGTGVSIAHTTVKPLSGLGSALVTPNGSEATPRIEQIAHLPIPASRLTYVAGLMAPTTANKPLRIMVHGFDASGSFLTTRGERNYTAVAGASTGMETVADWSDLPEATQFRIGFAETSTPAAGDTFRVDDAWISDYDASEGEPLATGLVGAADTAVLLDSYTGRTDSNGWGSRYAVHAGPAAQFTTTGSAGRITAAVKGTEYRIQPLITDVADVELRLNTAAGDMTADAGSNNPNTAFYLRYVDSDNWVQCKIWHTSGGNHTMSYSYRDAGTTTGDATFPTVSGTTSIQESVEVLIRLTGRKLQYKAWKTGTSEPAAFTFDVAVPVLAAGDVLLAALVHTSFSGTVPKIFEFDNLKIESISGPWVNDWTAWAQKEYEYRAIATGVNNTEARSPWTR